MPTHLFLLLHLELHFRLGLHHVLAVDAGAHGGIAAGSGCVAIAVFRDALVPFAVAPPAGLLLRRLEDVRTALQDLLPRLRPRPAGTRLRLCVMAFDATALQGVALGILPEAIAVELQAVRLGALATEILGSFEGHLDAGRSELGSGRTRHPDCLSVRVLAARTLAPSAALAFGGEAFAILLEASVEMGGGGVLDSTIIDV